MSRARLKAQLEEAADQILKLARPLPIQVFLRVKKGILARFANNGVHQNGAQDLFAYTLRLFGEHGFFQLESNDFSKSGVQSALKSLKDFVPKPEALAPSGKMKYVRVNEYFPIDSGKTPQMAARAIERGLNLIRPERASANGYLSAYERAFYFADANGLRLFHPATAVRFGVTVSKGSGKGYFSFYHPEYRKLDIASVVEEASRLARDTSSREVELEPGHYECVFSPRAFIELIEPLRPHFSESLYREGKSVFSGFLGRQVFSESFSLYDDLTHPGQFGLPFDIEGAPRKKAVLIEGGILKGLLAKGHSAQGFLDHAVYPQNLVAKEGDRSLPEILSRVHRGIFVNKLRYHTLVRESNMEVTGLATAGSFYIEDGRIKGRVSHLRYDDSLFSILGSLIGQSRERILLKDGEMGAAFLPYFWISKLRVV